MHLRKATGDLDKAECNTHMNEVIPFSYEEAGEATSEEKDRGSNNRQFKFRRNQHYELY